MDVVLEVDKDEGWCRAGSAHGMKPAAVASDPLECLRRLRSGTVGAPSDFRRLLLVASWPAADRALKHLLAQCCHEFPTIRYGCIESGPKSVLYACGLHTGVVVQVSEHVTRIVPVYELAPLHFSQRQVPLGGELVTRALQHAIAHKYGMDLLSASAWPSIEAWKRRACYVSADWVLDQRLANDTTALCVCAELPRHEPHRATSRRGCPAHTTVCISAERYEAPEVLFHPEHALPTLQVSDLSGIASHVFASIYVDSDISLRAALAANIIVCGSVPAYLPGFTRRLQTEVLALYQQHVTAGQTSIAAHHDGFDATASSPPLAAPRVHCAAPDDPELLMYRSACQLCQDGAVEWRPTNEWT
ncbi:hypothetical protein CDCA_CDCA02G0707 [Cyanidium caldarium]|uniref:N-acetyltransferase domain-containing protein n=1 Tax=Cyanidium caldarium TaxID=2771 RepID=A0AAV9IR17_CYACA|nr:hypothetical protein CDCA_CDCA02G0707 [Cyanidium caldarium]